MAETGGERIEVVGLRDFQRALRQAGNDFPKELRQANKDAADIVAEGTRRALLSRSGVAPKVAPSVRALAQQRNASVKIGGARYPYAMGANFGSVRYKQFPKPTKPDYALYRTIEARRDEVVDAYGDAIERLARRAFPD